MHTIDNRNTPLAVIKREAGIISWTGRVGTELGIFLIGGGASSYAEGGGGSGYIKYATYTMKSQSADISFNVGNGGCNRDNDWNSLDENGRTSSVRFPDGKSFTAAGGYRGGINGDTGGDGWSGGGGDDGGKGGSNGNNGGPGQYGDRGGYGTHKRLPEMNRVTLSPGAGGRGGSTASSSYDGGGGGGVLVDGTGPSIRRGTYNHESGEGYGAGGNYGYDGGVTGVRN